MYTPPRISLHKNRRQREGKHVTYSHTQHRFCDDDDEDDDLVEDHVTKVCVCVTLGPKLTLNLVFLPAKLSNLSAIDWWQVLCFGSCTLSLNQCDVLCRNRI